MLSAIPEEKESHELYLKADELLIVSGQVSDIGDTLSTQHQQVGIPNLPYLSCNTPMSGYNRTWVGLLPDTGLL